jgi:NADH-quinone oxidoreductase subunit L
MLLPLLILMVPAIFAGFANAAPDVVGSAGMDREIEHLITNALPIDVEIEATVFHANVAIMSTVVAVAGMVLAWLIYGLKLVSAASLLRLFRPLHAVLANKYYLDVLYERVIVDRAFYRALGGALLKFDSLVIDGAVNGFARTVRLSGGVLRHIQTGQFQTYGAIAFGGVAVTLFLVLILGPA